MPRAYRAGMVLPRTFEWDVMSHPSPNAWFDDLRTQGWTQVPGVPGAPTPQGTVVHEFEHQAPSTVIDPNREALNYRMPALLLAACAVGVAALVAVVIVVMAIVQS